MQLSLRSAMGGALPASCLPAAPWKLRYMLAASCLWLTRPAAFAFVNVAKRGVLVATRQVRAPRFNLNVVMRVFGKAFAIAFVALFVVSLVGLLRLEDLGKVDSIGLWYTVYSAAVFASIGALLLAAPFAMFFHQWRPRRK